MVQKKIAKSLMHHHSATVCSRITRLHENAQERSLSTSQCKTCINWLCVLWSTARIGHVMTDIDPHVNKTPLTVEDRLLIKTVQTKEGCWKNCWTVEKNYCWISSETVAMAYGVWSLENNCLLALLRGWVVAIDVVQSELIHISSRLIT